MSRRVVNHAPIGEYIEHCAMTGVGLLCYEVRRVSYDLRNVSNASALYSADLSLKSGSRFVFCRFYTGRITKGEKSYVTFAEKDGSTTVTEDIF